MYAERDARMTARNPVPVAEGTADTAIARWWERPDSVNERAVSVIYVRPLQAQAAPPPGLSAWPKPGQAYLSPALLDEAPEMGTRYGKLAGTVAPGGLADASELIAYVNPVQADFFNEVFEPTSRIRGFGNPDRRMFFVASHQFDRGLAELDLLVLIMAALPCAALIMVAVRSRAETRDRRLALLDALGAPTTTRALVVVGEAWAPIGMGVVVAGLLLGAVAWSSSPTLPFTGYQVWSADLQTALPQLPLVVLAVFAALVLFTVLASIRRPTRKGSRPARAGRGKARWPLWIFLLGFLVTAWGSQERGAGGRIAFVAGAVLTLATLPHSAGQLARLIGRRVAGRGQKAGDPVRIVAGRWLQARPATLARLSAALVVGLGIVTLGQVLTTQFAGPVEAARERYQASGAELVQVRSRNIPATAPAFVHAVGPDRVLRYSPESQTAQGEPKIRLTGTCDALRHLGELRECPASPQKPEQVFSSLSPAGVQVFRAQDLTSAPVTSVCHCAAPENGDKVMYGFLAINRDGDTGLSRIEEAAYTHLIGPMTALPGQGWVLGSAAQAAQIRWMLDIALLGLVALAAAGALGAAGIFLEQAKALGPLSAYRTDQAFYRRIALWNLALPLSAVGAIGVVVAAALGGLLINLGKGGWMSTTLLGVGLGTVAMAGLCVAWVCGRVAGRQAIVWRPQGD
ncbi:FtsX-like permease family protein [Streptomyces sp. NPDC033754]|uniref:FtsX-like permease family protein n=1 Tax=unclassified Streptomyces TaxID=2593676 RepID=UPI0033CE5EF2